MKKIFLILLCFPVLAFADDCANAYKAGLDLYKHRQYSEAQTKFIVVAKMCGDYADVWNKLKSCNQKLSEKQSQQASQIKSLKTELAQLEQTTVKPSSNALGQEALKNIDSIKEEAKQSKEQLKSANDTIATLKNKLKDANAELEKLRKDIESLNQKIEELNKTVAEPATKKGKKEIVSDKKKNAQPEKAKPQKENSKKGSSKKGTSIKVKE